MHWSTTSHLMETLSSQWRWRLKKALTGSKIGSSSLRHRSSIRASQSSRIDKICFFRPYKRSKTALEPKNLKTKILDWDFHAVRSSVTRCEEISCLEKVQMESQFLPSSSQSSWRIMVRVLILFPRWIRDTSIAKIENRNATKFTARKRNFPKRYPFT